MQEIRPCEVPLNSYLRSYKDAEGYADCYMGDVPGAITQAQFVEAFYTTGLFKVERTLLRYLAARPATDADAKPLAAGLATSFSAWRVEAQSESELLLADFTGPAEARRSAGDAFRVEARIVVWEGTDVLKVPVGALFREGESWAVFAVVDGRAELRRVDVGRRNSREAEITGGLAAGATVIVHPSDKLQAGVRVAPR